ncbi:MAG: PilZ domain-containing protein [Myxococcales bacterium]|nr:PilZ domain-containing protein [Myxococcales bacterium]
MADDHDDRRRESRLEHSATALVYVGNDTHLCHILNLGPRGLLVAPPVHHAPGAFVRLNLTLPALDEVIDVDGVIVREGEARGFYAWGIELVDPPARVLEVIRTYIRWARDNAAALREPQNKLPSSRAEEQLENKATGPAYPRVVREAREHERRQARQRRRLDALLGASGRATGDGARARSPGAGGKRTRSSLDAGNSYQAAQLRRLYRQALDEVGDDEDDDDGER